MFRMFRKIVDTIEEVKAAKKYAVKNNFGFFSFMEEPTSKTTKIFDDDHHLMGTMVIFQTNNFRLHKFLHLVTGGFICKNISTGKEDVTYPVTRRTRAFMMK